MNYLTLLLELPLTQGIFIIITISSFIGLLFVAIYGKIKGEDIVNTVLNRKTTMKDLLIITVLSVIIILLQTLWIHQNHKDKNMSDEEIIKSAQLVRYF